MKESNMPRADFVTSIGLIGFGIMVLVMALQMPRFEDQGASPYSVPGLVPGILGTVIAALGGVLLVRSIARGGHRLGLTGQAVRGFLREQTTIRFGLTILLGIIYALVLVGNLPYAVATAIFVFAFILIFEYDRSKSLAAQGRKVAVALLIAVLTSGAVTAVFRYLFLVNLPG